jgi:hypothetical protein
MQVLGAVQVARLMLEAMSGTRSETFCTARLPHVSVAVKLIL